MGRVDEEERTGGALRYAVLAVLFWLALYWGNYLTVYLKALGFSGTAIGYVSSGAAAAGMLGNYAAGRLSDLAGTVKKVALGMIFLTGLFFLLFPLTPGIVCRGVSLVLLWWPLACLFRAPACTLVENWIVRGSHTGHFRYGVVRSGGSVGSALSSVLASAMVTALYAFMDQTQAVACTYFTSGALMLLCGLYGLCVRDAAPAQKSVRQKGKGPALKRLFSRKPYAALTLFYFALSAFMNPPYVFLPYILEESGIDTALVGVIVGWEALLEVPLLFLLAGLRKRFSLRTLVVVSGMLFALTIVGQGLSCSLPALLLCGVFFGFANGLNFSCSFEYIYAITPKELRATAQTVYAIAGSVGLIVGNFLAGNLLDAIGTRPFYFLFGAAALAVSALYAAVRAESSPS